MIRRFSRLVSVLVFVFAVVLSGQQPPPFAAPLSRFIEHEIADKQIPALSIAVVEGDRIVWSQAFGAAKPDTVWRVGSISKLFTYLAVMQLAERREIDIDAPIAKYAPEFHWPITLRQLMAHRAGVLREPPVGHYFDAGEPTLAATAQSMADSPLVYPPTTHTKYSNAGVTMAGYIVQRVTDQPFAPYVKRNVLDRFGMRDSSFYPQADLLKRLPKALMWTYDGRTFDAPVFQFGIAPAGNLYSTVDDLARFAIGLFSGGAGVVDRATLHKMWTPQFAADAPFGIGFAVSKLEGLQRVGHSGAVYGFSTDLEMLPEKKLAVVVACDVDSSNAVTRHIAQETLRALVHGPRDVAVTKPVDPVLAKRLEGRQRIDNASFDFSYRNGELYVLPVRGGERVRVRQSDKGFIEDDRLSYGRVFELSKLHPVPVPKPLPVSGALRARIGEYGWDHDVLYILERDGKLNVLIEWFDYYPLEQVSENVFKFPRRGLYDGETLTFTPEGAKVGGVLFPRRSIGPESGNVFRIQPLKPVAQLRKEALADQPPVETGNFRKADLVDLTKLDPTIKLDIRYATSDNFLSTPVYTNAQALMQRPAAEAVARASRALRAKGFGLLIHDAYRPWYITKVFWDATPEDKRIFVADPSKGSRHNRGCAVDLTLYDLKTGKAVEMTGVYDEMSPRSYPDYPGGTALARWHRDLLRHAMEHEGFQVYDFEWWHFDYKDWQSYPILNVDDGARVAAFPGAEGAGMYTTGGRGGSVYRVTNLNAKGPGSLADAVSRPNRIVVFTVSGTIDLGGKKLEIGQPNITIAGQTAPGEGIALKGGQLRITAGNVIVRHLRVRRGFNQIGDMGDCVDLKGDFENAMLDHLSTAWATDENLTLTNANRVTAQYSIAAEGLDYFNPNQSPNRHSEGSLFGSSTPSGQMTVHHTLYAHNRLRNPRTTGGGDPAPMLDIRNNVIYDSREYNTHTGSQAVRINLINNYYREGPSSETKGVIFTFMNREANQLYANGNFVDGYPDRTANNRLAIADRYRDAKQTLLTTALPTPEVATQSAADAFETVLDEAGATLPARDAIDLRIVRDVRNRTGAVVNYETDIPEAGRWQQYHSLPAPVDSDGDGIPDYWQRQFHLPNHSAAKLSGSYANIEHYFNNTDPTGGTTPIVYINASVSRAYPNSPGELRVWRTGDLTKPLTVRYTGGTATIPAGAKWVAIPVAKQLTAEIQPSAAYHIGCPNAAMVVFEEVAPTPVDISKVDREGGVSDEVRREGERKMEEHKVFKNTVKKPKKAKGN